jgi:PST family polysaccharide transporter
MLRYCLSYSSSTWALQLYPTVNPLVVGHFAGPEAVGLVAFAVRILENLSFVKTAASRVAISALAKVQGDRQRLARAIAEGSKLQLLALGPILLLFSLVAPWILPWIFGKAWMPIVDIFPYLAISYILNALFGLHSAALYVVKRNGMVAIANLLRITLLFGVSAVLVSRFGIVGYGWAECIAASSYALLYYYTCAAIAPVPMAAILAVALTFSLVLFWQQLGLAAGVGFLVILAWPKARDVLASPISLLRELRAR